MKVKKLSEIQFLFNSEKRIQVLCEISQGANTGRQLKEKIKIPKSSLNRCIEQLAKKSLIELDDESLVVTGYGNILLEEVLEFTERFSSIAAAKELFCHCFSGIPKDLLIRIKMLREIKFVNISKLQPYWLSEYYLSEVKQAESVKAILPLLPIGMNIFRERFLQGLNLDIIITEKIFNLLKQELEKENFPENFNFLSIIRDEIPFLLTIFDEKFIFFYHDNRTLKGLKSRNPDSLKWGEELLDYYKKKASPLIEKSADRYSHMDQYSSLQFQ